MVSDEKPFSAHPVLNLVILHLGSPRRLTPISTHAQRRHEIVTRLKVVLTWDYMTVRMIHLMILHSVAAFWMMMGILLRRRLRHNHQTDRALAPMHILHHRMPIVNRRILRF
jgi:hypothetical protein